jgi:PIN domain nuclease of toxin-antitoxin system
METFYLDTHAAIWLYAGKGDLFPERLLTALERSELYISPFVLLEVQFLRESGKVQVKVDTFLREMKQDFGLKLCPSPFASVALEAVRVSWTRDPFDRMIVAQASVNEARLITRDREILEHYHEACWDIR